MDFTKYIPENIISARIAPQVTAAIMMYSPMWLSTRFMELTSLITLNSPVASGVTMLTAMTFSPEGSLPVNVPELPLSMAS